uniref:Uncharacterized protein n=1 Tax=Peronospora matthiolae TaxID=2874970 RepID=A0AAV1T0H3_9STRA
MQVGISVCKVCGWAWLHEETGVYVVNQSHAIAQSTFQAVTYDVLEVQDGMISTKRSQTPAMVNRTVLTNEIDKRSVECRLTHIAKFSTEIGKYFKQMLATGVKASSKKLKHVAQNG